MQNAYIFTGKCSPLIINQLMDTRLALLLATLLVACASASCDTNIIQVSGNAEIKVVPNIATLTIRVESTAKTTSEALKNVNIKTQEVFKIFKDQGIAEKDYSTAGLNISPEYDYSGDIQVLLGQKSSQTLSVKIRNLTPDGAKIGSLITALAALGDGVIINGVTFDQENKKIGVKDARKAAFESAKTKAAEFAELSGKTLGRVKRIESVDGNSYVPFFSVAASAANLKLLVPVRDVTISEQVKVIFSMR